MTVLVGVVVAVDVVVAAGDDTRSDFELVFEFVNVSLGMAWM